MNLDQIEKDLGKFQKLATNLDREIASKSVSDMAFIDMTTQINEMEEIRKKKGF